MKIGIIGGTGLEQTSLQDLNTPKIELCFISRHGVHHNIPPSDVNYLRHIKNLRDWKANLIIGFTACGSLKEEFKPGSFVIPDQFIDHTYKRDNAWPRIHNVVHTPMANPFDQRHSILLYELLKRREIDVHLGGTIITIEGPRFSTKAESLMYKSWGADIINMTTATECILANEVAIPYVTVAMVTDYDCWKPDHDAVSMDMINKVMATNKDKAITLVKDIVKYFN